MDKMISLLDCTLRDGAYVVDGKFGDNAIKGIIKKLTDANIDIIECGWLKDSEYEEGTSYFHVPGDLISCIGEKSDNTTYVVMIDYNRYNIDSLPENDGKSIDAIRVVFPYGQVEEGIRVGRKIKEKGYKVYFQAANTLVYTNDDLKKLARATNELKPVGLSVVDTFGAMYEDDLERIVKVLDVELDEDIELGFHSHNNQQISFALVMSFVNMLKKSNRNIILDSTLCGMGRGAGNAATELVCNYLNNKQSGNYDMNVVMDVIDIYMSYFLEKYSWGYSTPYFIAGMYCCHVNNIAYLQKNHRTNSRDMRNIIESLSPEDRKKYDYDLLEKKYIENQDRLVDDEETIEKLRNDCKDKNILLVAPGKSVITEKEKVKKYIEENNPIVIAVNALNDEYTFDYLFLISSVRYDYAKEMYPEIFFKIKKILLSCIKTEMSNDEMIINFNRVVKYGWEHFDNAVLDCLRLLDNLHVKNVAIAGFDEFKNEYNESYADEALPTVNPDNNWTKLNEEILDMFMDIRGKMKHIENLQFITKSYFDVK